VVVLLEAGLLVEVEVEELGFLREEVVPLQDLEFMKLEHQDLVEKQDQKKSEELVVLVVGRQVVEVMEEIHQIQNILRKEKILPIKLEDHLVLMDMRLYR
jgi:hypothetical protein